MKTIFKNIINKLPYVRGLYKIVKNFNENSYYPAGHFYSPIINVKEVKAKQNEIWKTPLEDKIEGINLNTSNQLDLVSKLNCYYKDIPFDKEKQPDLRYYFENKNYSYTDGIMLYNMMRHYKPKQIIEVGSGFSSALMLDVNEKVFNNDIKLTFIEPYPVSLNSLIYHQDKQNNSILKNFVQDISIDVFKKLEAGDILFIDSTHVSKTGSDVNYIFFEILPQLKKGVIIHFHDVFYPFEYPKDWVFTGKNWNEDYLLRAFLMYNSDFEIKIFSHYLHLMHKKVFENMPLAYHNFGGNIWLEKIK